MRIDAAIQTKRLRTAFMRSGGALALAWLLPMPAAGQVPGDLDPTFGTGGIVITDFGGVENAGGVAIQPDGKIVVAGESNTIVDRNFAVARYLPDGTLDPTFGSGGVVFTGFGGFEYFSSVIVQTDGKIVGGGRFDSDFALVRYLPNGALDLGFGTGGLVRTDLGSIEEIEALILQPDGKLVAAGYTLRSTFDFALTRYNADGTPDATFGGGTGRVISDWAAAELVVRPGSSARRQTRRGRVVRTVLCRCRGRAACKRRLRVGSLQRRRHTRRDLWNGWSGDHRVQCRRPGARRGRRRPT